jgi:hypothetical protein
MELYAIQHLNTPTRSIFLVILGKAFHEAKQLRDRTHFHVLKLNVKIGSYLTSNL